MDEQAIGGNKKLIAEMELFREGISANVDSQVTYTLPIWVDMMRMRLIVTKYLQNYDAVQKMSIEELRATEYLISQGWV